MCRVPSGHLSNGSCVLPILQKSKLRPGEVKPAAITSKDVLESGFLCSHDPSTHPKPLRLSWRTPQGPPSQLPSSSTFERDGRGLRGTERPSSQGEKQNQAGARSQWSRNTHPSYNNLESRKGLRQNRNEGRGQYQVHWARLCPQEAHGFLWPKVAS